MIREYTSSTTGIILWISCTEGIGQKEFCVERGVIANRPVVPVAEGFESLHPPHSFGEGDQESEVFLNIHPAIRKGQFSMKDPDYGDLVLKELAQVL
jgi:hypothetical protein